MRPRAPRWRYRWEVHSTSVPDRMYAVTFKFDGTWACSCPAWRFHRAPRVDCKHIVRVQEVEGAVPRRPVPAVCPAPVPLPLLVLTQTRRSIVLED